MQKEEPLPSLDNGWEWDSCVLQRVRNHQESNFSASGIFTWLLSEDGSYEDILDESAFVRVLGAVVAVFTIATASCLLAKEEGVTDWNARGIDEIHRSVASVMHVGVECRVPSWGTSPSIIWIGIRGLKLAINCEEVAVVSVN